MTDSLRMYIRQGAKKLIDVDLDLQDRHGGLHLVEESGRAVHGLRHEFENQVQVDLVLLERTRISYGR